MLTTRLYTSAPVDYDGFSTRTIKVVGRHTRTGQPVREIEIGVTDFAWQTERYSSGLHAYTTPHMKLEDFVRLGDWALDDEDAQARALERVQVEQPPDPDPVEPKRETIAAFAERVGITIASTQITSRPDCNTMSMTKEELRWQRESYHWDVLLRREGRPSMQLFFSRGAAYAKKFYFLGDWHYKPTPPKLDLVLSYLRSDARDFLNTPGGVGFEEWATDLGYDPDSRKAEKVYRACQDTARDLARFMGADLAAFLECEEM